MSPDGADGGVRFADLEVGHEVVTHSRTITDADVREFAGVSGDFNPLHLSETYTAETPFGEPIAHGALLFAITSGLLWQYRHERPDLVAFYGAPAVGSISRLSIGSPSILAMLTAARTSPIPLEPVPR
jgi:3-hydroxybutyryl-CoA dehydratase